MFCLNANLLRKDNGNELIEFFIDKYEKMKALF